MKSFNDFKKEWEKYRIRLSEDKWKQNLSNVIINVNDSIVELVQYDYPKVFNMLYPINCDGVVFGRYEKKTAVARSIISETKPTSNYTILGSLIGLSIYHKDDDTKVTNDDILKTFSFVSKFNLKIKKFIMFIRCKNSIEAYLLNSKVFKLFKENILLLDENLEIIKSKKKLEIFEKNGVRETFDLPIYLSYTPIAIIQNNT